MVGRSATTTTILFSCALSIAACDEAAPDGRGLGVPELGDEDERIYGGSTVESCGWPSTVSLGGSCTGTLVHPEVVVYAAHCGASYSSVRFGEYAFGGSGFSVPTESCAVLPGGGPGNGQDFAYCVLKSPVTSVPIVPIMMGCELDALQPGTDVTLVGFGNADNGPYGYKREVTTVFHGLTGAGEASIGGGGKDTCQGDSGGPAFVRLDDGSWRVFGVTSYGGACGGGGYDSVIPLGIEWLEEASGYDLTPCHDADGTWNPGPDCGGFPLDPGDGAGTWANGCSGGDLSGASATCGDPWGDAAGDGGGDDAPAQEPEDPPPSHSASGTLSAKGDHDVQPASGYYQAAAGVHQATLDGPAGADFDLYLYKYVDGSWQSIGSAATAASGEHLHVESSAGYFAWLVHSYAGAGSYTLSWDAPTP